MAGTIANRSAVPMHAAPRRFRARVLAAGIAALCLWSATPAGATHDGDADEGLCRQATTKAIDKFVVAKAKCLIKCDRDAQKGTASASDCLPPFAGAALECVGKAEEKARSSISKRCSCVECSETGDCSRLEIDQVAAAELTVEAFVPILLCDDSASPDGLTPEERKCRDAAALALANLGAAEGKCIAKCHAREHRGQTDGSCAAPVADSAASACVADAVAKATAKLDGACAEAPECLEPQLASLPPLVSAYASSADAEKGCKDCETRKSKNQLCTLATGKKEECAAEGAACGDNRECHSYSCARGFPAATWCECACVKLKANGEPPEDIAAGTVACSHLYAN